MELVQVSRRELLGTTLLGAATLASVTACASESDSVKSDGESTGSEGSTRRIGDPIAMYRSSWSTDPFSLGGYSFMAVGATPEQRRVLATPLDNRVFFAGEATASGNPATVHGAQESGRRVAAEVLEIAEDGERVVVVGAGAAGITAARLLADNGFDVLVIEARDRIGGRIHTVTTDSGLAIEMGASWVHDLAASDLADQLKELGIEVAPFDYDAQSILGGASQRVDDIDDFVNPAEAAITAAIEWAGNQEFDLSLAEAVEQSGEAQDVDPAALDFVNDSAIATEYGASATEMSAWWGFEEGSEGDDVIVVGGYDGIVRAQVEGLHVEMMRPVQRIEWGAAGVVVVDGDAAEIEAARVIVTVPLGVLKSESITFQPKLPPDKLEAIASIGFGLLDKVWFVFDEAFWTEESLVWNLVGEWDTPYREWFNLQPLIGQPVLLALVGGNVAREWSQRSDADVKAAALSALQQFVDAGW